MLNNQVTILFLLYIFIANHNIAQANESEEITIDQLRGLSLAELMNVEIKTVTIASGIEQTVAKAPSVTSMITAEEIKEMGATDLDDILETVPGLHVARYYVEYNPIYTIRGVYSIANPQVLMLVNGIPTNNLLTGNRSQFWGGMPVSNIERVEVIRGPGSAIYGADAFSGVINVITKTAKHSDEKGEIGLRTGSFNTQEAWLSHHNAWQDLKVDLALEYRTTDGQKEIIDADYQTTYDALFGTHASFAPDSVSLEGKTVDTHLTLQYHDWKLQTIYQKRDDFGTGAGSAQALDTQGKIAEDRLNTHLIYHNPEIIPHWDVTADLSYSNVVSKSLNDVLVLPPGAFGGSYPDGMLAKAKFSENNTRFDLSSLYTGFNSHQIRLGIGYHYGDLYEVTHSVNYGIHPITGLPITPMDGLVDLTDTSSSILPEVDRKSYYTFLQDTWDLNEQWQITGGIRYDKYSDFGSTVNPRLALVWQNSEQLTTKLLYGSAFRAPSFTELYGRNNPVVLGNPNVQPELMKTVELAFDYRPMNNLQLSANIFLIKSVILSLS